MMMIIMMMMMAQGNASQSKCYGLYAQFKQSVSWSQTRGPQTPDWEELLTALDEQ